MAIMKYYRQGTTDPVAITLYSRGAPADITGYTSVALFLTSHDGLALVEKATGGSGITVTDADAGAISVQFDEGDLLYAKAGYRGYVLVVDGQGNRAAFPEGEEFIFVMRPRYTNDD